MVNEYEYPINIVLSGDDFKASIGRLPANQDEFEEWAMLMKKGLLDGHIDWDILYECACDAFHQQMKVKQNE